MTTARRHLVSIEATAYYHCVSRCVRRSFLCGEDKLTHKSYEHRREWVEQKILSLTRSYCIDICAYAVMSNHYHLVLHVSKDKALALSQKDVVLRWKLEHKLPPIIQMWLKGNIETQAQEKQCDTVIEQWRERLWSLSWFMKEINYDIACKANLEDECTGHFWESRFKSQALLDEKALAAAMAYVDLNPVRAGISETPENSEYTSIKARIEALGMNLETAPCLYPFVEDLSNKAGDGAPLKLLDYIQLVDWTARQFRTQKASLDAAYPPILTRLDLSKNSWLVACTKLEAKGITAIGARYHAVRAKALLDKTKVRLYQLE